MRYRIIPYKMGSKSAKALATRMTELSGKKVWRAKTTRAGWANINWGCAVDGGLNPKEGLEIARNKLKTFELLKDKEDVVIPWFTTSLEEAKAAKAEGKDILARKILTGHSGAGIVDFTGEEVAPLYVSYVKKKTEFRVHVFGDTIIHVQEKRRRKQDGEANPANSRIRNLANGWVFCQDNINPNDKVLLTAVAAVKHLGLQWGAADIIWNEKYQKAVLLEVNTAPGLEGTTIDKYAKAFLGV